MYESWKCKKGIQDGDGFVNVLDVVAVVNGVISGPDYYDECVDVNNDGAVNVMDVVAIVNIIISPRQIDATSATMHRDGGSINISGDGYIGAVQMTLSHGADFSIELTSDAMVADYRTNDNTTTLIVVVPGSDGKVLLSITCILLQPFGMPRRFVSVSFSGIIFIGNVPPT